MQNTEDKPEQEISNQEKTEERSSGGSEYSSDDQQEQQQEEVVLDANGNPLSKKQLKKRKNRAKRADQFRELKRQKREQEKIRKREERKAKNTKPDNISEEEWNKIQQQRLEICKENIGNRKKRDAARKKAQLQILQDKVTNNVGVCIDCNFDELMTEAEISSMKQQLQQCYGINMKRLEIEFKESADENVLDFEMKKKPLYLCFTSLNKRLGVMMNNYNGFHQWNTFHSEQHFSEVFPKENLIYLTADSETEMDTVDNGKIYILGGLVDRNRHKNLCFNEAQKYGIQTAKFPIKKYGIELKSSTVLTVNQCFDILQLVYSNGGDWVAAFDQVVPPRKRK